MIHMRLGSVPLLIMPYLGGLKGMDLRSRFQPFRRVGFDYPLTRHSARRGDAANLLSAHASRTWWVWAIVTLWIMALDPANVFPSRLDWGPTVLTHFFQAAILALWFSYRNKPGTWKMVLIFICFGLGFFDKFNFVWLILAFVIGISLCYADSLKNIWALSPRLARHIAVILALTALSATLYFILPVLLHFHPARRHTMSLQMK